MFCFYSKLWHFDLVTNRQVWLVFKKMLIITWNVKLVKQRQNYSYRGNTILTRVKVWKEKQGLTVHTWFTREVGIKVSSTIYYRLITELKIHKHRSGNLCSERPGQDPVWSLLEPRVWPSPSHLHPPQTPPDWAPANPTETSSVSTHYQEGCCRTDAETWGYKINYM